MTELRTSLNSILSVLKHEIDLDLWMVTRVVDDDWIMLSTTDNSYNIQPDDVVEWSTTVCNRMVANKGPNIVPVVSDVEAYANSPIASKLNFKSYIGYPLNAEDGKLMGTLCAIDPSEQDPSILEQASLMQDFVKVVESLMQQHQEILRLNTLLKDYMSLDDVDELIGLPNEDAFFAIAETQKELMQSSGMPLAMILVDIQKFENESVSSANRDAVLRGAKTVLLASTRDEDVLCKLKGDRFGLLLMNADSKELTSRVVELLKQLQAHHYKLSVGAHVCRQNESISDAMAAASQRSFA